MKKIHMVGVALLIVFILAYVDADRTMKAIAAFRQFLPVVGAIWAADENPIVPLAGAAVEKGTGAAADVIEQVEAAPARVLDGLLGR